MKIKTELFVNDAGEWEEYVKLEDVKKGIKKLKINLKISPLQSHYLRWLSKKIDEAIDFE